MSATSTMLALLVGHTLCDYPLQGSFLAAAKNHRNPIQGINPIWCLLCHSAIHGGMVAFVTGSMWAGGFEFLTHAIIDYAKCDGRIGFMADQWLHVACKVLIVLALAGGAA